MKKMFTSIGLSLVLMAGVSAQDEPVTKKWQGGINRDWDEVTANWVPVEGLALPTTFSGGNAALFDESRGDGEGADSVNVVGEIEVADITVNIPEDVGYNFTSGGADSKFFGAGTLTKEGEGEMIISVLNELEGGTLVKGGLVTKGSADDPEVFGSTVVLENNGGIKIGTSVNSSSSYADFSGDLMIEAGQEGTFISNRYAELFGNFSGEGTLNFIGRGERTFARFDSISWAEFTGNINISGDFSGNPGYAGLGLQTSETWNAEDFEGTDKNLANAKVHLYDRGALYSQSGERCYEIGELSGDETSELYGYMRSSTTPGIYYMVGGLNTDALFEGVIRPVAEQTVTIGGVDAPMPRRDNRVGLVKVGTGDYTFTNGMNYITGGIDVREGKVFISNAEGTRSGTGHSTSYGTVVWVGDNGGLGGTGRISGSVDVSGTLEPGENGIGTLTIADFVANELPDGDEPKAFSAILRENSKIEMELSEADSSDMLIADSLLLYPNVTLDIKLATDYDLSEGDEIKIFETALEGGSEEFAGILLPKTDDGWEWDTSSLYETGIITLTTGGGTFVGIDEEISSLSDVVLYPNPSYGDVNVVLPSGNSGVVEIFNTAGSMVLEKQIEGTQTSVVIPGDAKGLFIVRITSGDEVVVRKLLVK